MFKTVSKTRRLLIAALILQGLVPISLLIPGILGISPAFGICAVVVLSVLLFAAGCVALWLARSGYMFTDVAIALMLVPLIHLCAAGIQKPWELNFTIAVATLSVYGTAIGAWRNT